MRDMWYFALVWLVVVPGGNLGLVSRDGHTVLQYFLFFILFSSIWSINLYI